MLMHDMYRTVVLIEDLDGVWAWRFFLPIVSQYLYAMYSK